MRRFERAMILTLCAVMVISSLAWWQRTGELRDKIEALEQRQAKLEQEIQAAELTTSAVVVIGSDEPETNVEDKPVDSASELKHSAVFTVTNYCPCVKCCGVWSAQHPSRQGTGYVQRTASGTVPKEGRTVGVDPAVIPLGTHLWIDGHEYIAEDTGSGVGGRHIDVYWDSHEASIKAGVRKTTVEW